MTALLHNRPANPTVSVVIPAMNEARNLEVILPKLPPVDEVVLVDGESVDDTVEVAERLLPGIKIVNQTRKGKGNALACGFEEATGDILVMFDADGSADPLEIPRFVEVLTAGADFAKGSRFCDGGGSADITRFRRLGNFGLNALANSMMRTRFTDLCYGFNAFWSDVLHHLDLPSTGVEAYEPPSMVWGDGFEIETVLNCRVAAAGLNITEVPSYEKPRIYGLSNLNAVSDGFRVLKTLGTERRRARELMRSERVLSRRPRRRQRQVIPVWSAAVAAEALLD
ncbi:MAG TPA: glycosyltransferase family 2 protein [Jatrophihabitantaceae bacterium]|nr:glycosyltransferase family 2 protein [Jatrophihabitantaceae bacterium]